MHVSCYSCGPFVDVVCLHETTAWKWVSLGRTRQLKRTHFPRIANKAGHSVRPVCASDPRSKPPVEAKVARRVDSAHGSRKAALLNAARKEANAPEQPPAPRRQTGESAPSSADQTGLVPADRERVSPSLARLCDTAVSGNVAPDGSFWRGHLVCGLRVYGALVRSQRSSTFGSRFSSPFRLV